MEAIWFIYVKFLLSSVVIAGRLLMACFKQRGDCASELLHQLEDAIMLKLEEEDISP